jgi:hypothetical protein
MKVFLGYSCQTGRCRSKHISWSLSFHLSKMKHLKGLIFCSLVLAVSSLAWFSFNGEATQGKTDRARPRGVSRVHPENSEAHSHCLRLCCSGWENIPGVLGSISLNGLNTAGSRAAVVTQLCMSSKLTQFMCLMTAS